MWPGQLFHFYHKFLRRFCKSRKLWKKLAWPTFSNIFMIPKTSSKIRGKSAKSWPGQHFPRLKPFWRPKSWKMLARPTFSTIFVKNKTFSGIRGKSGKSLPGQHFPRFGLPKWLESWKMLARPTFSTIFVMYIAPQKFVEKVEKVGLATFWMDRGKCWSG